MPFISYTLKDADFLHVTGVQASTFRDDEQLGRFSLAHTDSDFSSEMLINSQQFDNGSLLWYSTASDALLAYKIYEAEGYEAHLLYDEWDTDDLEYVVLTSYHIFTKEDALDAVDIMSFIFLLDDDEEDKIEEIKLQLPTILRKKFEVFSLGEEESNGQVMIQATVESSLGEMKAMQQILVDKFDMSVGILKSS